MARAHPKNLLIIRVGEATKSDRVRRMAKVTLVEIAKIIHDCVILGKTIIISGPDKVDMQSAQVIKDEFDRLNTSGVNLLNGHDISMETSELLGKKHATEEDDDDEEQFFLNRNALSREIVDLIQKVHAERFMATVILVTHYRQTVVTQERYALEALGDAATRSFGGVAIGSGIWMHNHCATAMSVPLHGELRYSKPKDWQK